MPGAVRPARPRRWSAASRETRVVSRRVIPERGEKRGTRASPESTTIRTPSMVRLVSATDVASTTFRVPAGASRRDRAILLFEREGAVQRIDDGAGRNAVRRQKRLDAPDFAGAGQEREQVALVCGERAAYRCGDRGLDVRVRPPRDPLGVDGMRASL